MAKKTGLGKGLGALFNDTVLEEDEEFKSELKDGEEIVHKIKLIDIEPNKNQPRRNFDEESLSELAESIKRYGIIQPIIVNKKDNYYEIVAGERRWRAAKKAGLEEIPCIVREDTERRNKEIALIENIQREDLNAIEKAKGYKELIDNYGLSQIELSETIGMSSSAIANTLRLLNLSPKVMDFVIERKISEAHARQLLYFDDPEEQYKYALEVMEKGISVHDLERKVKTLKNIKNKHKTAQKNIKQNAIVKDIEDTFQGYFGTKVKLQAGTRSGKIIIQYSSNDDLERILELVKK